MSEHDMVKKKTVYNRKTLDDLSNPYRNLDHKTALKLAKVPLTNGSYRVKELPNGRIVVEAEKKKPKS